MVTGSRLPDLVIIGAPKAGTTSLAAWLKQHPGMRMSGNKELEFLDRNFERGTDWYRQQFPDARPDQLLGEATPAYLAHPLAPSRAAAALPEARFVAVLREPVARAWSHYTFLRWLGVEHRSWERALARAEAGKGPADYLGDGRYAEHLARWDAAVGAERTFVMLFEEITRDPAEAFRRVCRFAGLSDSVDPPSTESVNPTRRPRNLPLQVALHTTGLSRRRYGRELHGWNLSGGPPGRMDPALEQRIRARFQEDNDHLEQRLGMPLPASWRPREVGT